MKAIVKQKSAPLALSKIEEDFTTVLTKLAVVVSTLVPSQLSKAHNMFKTGIDALEAMHSMVKQNITKLVVEEGELITEKGSKAAVVDGIKFTIQPNRTGYDPKKIEALIRMRGCAPEVWMDTNITFSVNEGKLDALLKLGDKVTKDELELCRYNLTYKVMPTEEVG
jgi:hypothetical protein